MTVTIGADTFNVIGSSAGLATYANGSLTWRATYAAALAADADNPKRALVEATGIFDALAWDGDLTSDGQANSWPRSSVTATPPSGIAVTDGTTPTEIERGVYELALAILQSTSVVAGTGASSNVQSVTAGPTSVTFFSPKEGGQAPELPGRVRQWVGWALSGAATSDLAPGGMFASDGGCSQFDACNEYDLTGPA